MSQEELYIKEKKPMNHIARADEKEMELIEEFINDVLKKKMKIGQKYFIDFVVHEMKMHFKRGDIKNHFSASLITVGYLMARQEWIKWDNTCSGLGKFIRKE